jgi:hypothetical protein
VPFGREASHPGSNHAKRVSGHESAENLMLFCKKELRAGEEGRGSRVTTKVEVASLICAVWQERR